VGSAVPICQLISFEADSHTGYSHSQTSEIKIEVSLNMGEMRRAIAREQDEERRKMDRFKSTIVIAASIIAAVRLARDDISRPSPRLTSTLADSVRLAQMILQKVMR
jgi:hypothetical protein